MHLVRILTVALLLAATLAAPGRAATLLRDADIEHALKRLAEPILDAAGLGATRTDIVLVDDRSLNAFVVDRSTIFIHSGLLLKMESAAMLQAVIAHEAAHIANGHLARRPVNLRNARTAAGIGMALAAAAAVASGRGEVATLGAVGASNSAMRMFFVHTRAEENAADQSGIRFLTRAGVDPRGMVEVMDIFRGQEMLSSARQDPYARTHPLSRDRYRVVQRLAEAHGGQARDNREAEYWFHRAKGKLSAFARSPKWTMNRLGESGFADVTAMREAVAHHRRSDLGRASAAIDRAIAARPEDPYYHDLKGQILFESRRFSAAAAAYGRARNLAPGNALILGAYGRALLAAGETAQAVEYLEQSRARDGRDPRVLRDLAQAHAKLGNRGMASLVTAERYAMNGRLKDAGIHAKRASDMLPRGSTGWRRAQDVLSASERAEEGN
ncbi:M48 family metalloprotease [Roseovarius salis]|uniref:M48 family metalloprotease n=1 Tax=Roseovarius salis TaxID=3376063 RepID=UPI0037C9FF9F